MDGRNYKRIINIIYSYIDSSKLTSKVYHDENWQGVSEIRKIVDKALEVAGKIYGEVFTSYISVENGGYGQSKDGLSSWKDYILNIDDEGGKRIITGTITCSFCGTVKDPMNAYDCTVVIYPNVD